MKNNRKLFLFLIAFLFACTNKDVVKISDFSPQGKIEKLSNITIEFSKELAPPELIDLWLDDEFVKFTPEIKGKFKWLDSRTLIFSPDTELEPIQDYTAKVTNKVLFNTKYEPDFQIYKFHTPEFDVKKIDFFWTQVPHENYKVSIKANIYFNHAVSPAQLKNYLEVRKGGKVINDFSIVTKEASKVIAINFGKIAQAEKKQKFKVKIKKGLQSVYGKKPMQDTREFSQTLPPITKLAITRVNSGFNGSYGWIEVSTTQTVDKSRLKEFVQLKPNRKLQFYVNENRFRIETKLNDIKTVTLKLKKGLPGLYGGELEFDFEKVITLVNLKPSIKFTDKKGKYLLLGGEQNLEVSAVNIKAADVEVIKIYENNLIHFLNRYSYSYYDDYDYYGENYTAGNDGKNIYTNKIKLNFGKNSTGKFTVNLNKVLKSKYKGIYIVNVRSNEKRWVNDSKIVAISDIGVIAKYGRDEIMVFTNSISTTQPLQGVDVNIISSNNQIILSGMSNSDGVVRFKNIKEKIKGFTPRLITVLRDDDFNYLDLRNTYIETSRYDVGGLYEQSENYNVFIYSDRNIYRPGDKVNISAILRDDKINIVADIPVLVKIISPTGKTFDEFKKTLNQEGSFELSFNLPDYVQTGNYNARLYTAGKMLIGSYGFSVEDFVPDKIRVNVEPDKKEYLPKEEVKINVDAEFLFGAKAAGLKYESEIQLKHRPFGSKRYRGYNFSSSSVSNSNISNIQMDGKLDNNGKTTIKYKISKNLRSKGIVKGYAYVSVFDLTGRTVNRTAIFTIKPNDYYLGIKSPGYYYSTNDNISVNLIAVDRTDNAIDNFNVVAKLIRYEWQTVLKRDNSNKYYYASERKEVDEWQKDIVIPKSGKQFSFNVKRSGKYQLRIYKKGSNDYIKKNFYAYGFGRSTASSFEVDKEGKIDIVFDKQSYQPGEKAKVLFTTPFSGKMLITLERKNIEYYKYVEVKNKSAEISIPVTENFMPNVYVTATLFKKHTVNSTSPFLVGHGIASMKVEKKNNKLPVKIISENKIKPNTTQEITIKTKPENNIYITLAAVDEGILQVKDFVTPNPYGFMYAKRALNVSSYDFYKLLLPEIVSNSSSTGGDEVARQLKKRTNPVTTKRFKLLSIWSGIRKTNSKGIVKVKLNIPQFNGEVRLMAVAYSGKRFGNAEKKMKVSDDLIIEPEIPRFLSTNDDLHSNVSLINTTGKDGKVSVTCKVEGPLKVVSEATKTVNVPANSTASVTFDISANENIGKGKIIFTSKGFANIKDEIEIGVRPVSPLVSETGVGTIKAGEKIKLNIPQNFLKNTQKTTITISKFPTLHLAKHLKYLVKYPYGCIEQTVSKLFPQLYFEDLAKSVAPEFYKTTTPVYFVNEGIRKIETMQLYDGSMAYWQGGTYSSWWGTVYAAHFLVEAKKANYNIKEDVLTKLLSYLAKRAKRRETFNYTVYSKNKRTQIKRVRKEIIYSLYVLALAGKGDIATMNYYKARPHLIYAEDEKYLLAGAYAAMEKRTAFNEIIPRVFKPAKATRETGGTFNSEGRANSLMLNVLLEVDPSNEKIAYMVKHLSRMLDKMYSTQERAFTLLALGKAANKNSDAKVVAKIISNNKTLATFTGKNLTYTGSKINNDNLIIEAKGNGKVYYFWNTEGIKINEPVKEEDSFMKVRRTYYNYRKGTKITNNEFKQGDLIVCKISLTGYEKSAENIVISDLIPAGFEIENPRLKTSTNLTWKPVNKMYIQYMDVRDDRLLLFTTLQRKKTTEFFYMLRVVNKGKYNLPVIGAEAMYDREFHSFNGAGVVTVLQK